MFWTTELLPNVPQNCPDFALSEKTGQSKAFIEIKDQKSVCMNIKNIVTTNMIGSTELKNEETTFTFLY